MDLPKQNLKGPVLQDLYDVRLSPERYFYLCNGDVIRGLLEFVRMLRTMDDDIFNYHSRDFLNWLRTSLDQSEIAEAIAGKTRQEALMLLEKLLKASDGS